MNYVLRSSIHKRKIFWPFKVVGGITVVLVILHFVAPTFLSSIITTIVSPVWSINSGNRPGLNPTSDNAKDLLISELTKENLELKEIMNRTVSQNLTLAYVLKKPPFTAYDSFILDVGSNDKIEKGDGVYVSGNILIGEIEEVFANTSKVKLYSTYGEKYDVLIGEKNVQVTAIGRGGGLFETIIPRDVKVLEGDTIIIPNISNSVFGIVSKVIADPARAFSTIIFSQPINIYEQKWVQIYEKTRSN